MPLWGLIKALEEAGEVNCKVAEHRLTKDAGSIKIEPETTVCFLLDALKVSKKKTKACGCLLYTSPSPRDA